MREFDNIGTPRRPNLEMGVFGGKNEAAVSRRDEHPKAEMKEASVMAN